MKLNLAENPKIEQLLVNVEASRVTSEDEEAHVVHPQDRLNIPDSANDVCLQVCTRINRSMYILTRIRLDPPENYYTRIQCQLSTFGGQNPVNFCHSMKLTLIPYL